MPNVGPPPPPRKRAQKPKEEPSSVICCCCGTTNVKQFYMSHGLFNRAVKYIPYCKDCIKKIMWPYFLKKYRNNEQLALHCLLRSLDVPYIHSIYQSCVKTLTNPTSKFNSPGRREDGELAVVSEEESEKVLDRIVADDDGMLVSAYFKNLNSMYARNGYGGSYADSQGIEEIQGVTVFDDNIRVRRKKRDPANDKVDEEKYEVIEYDSDELVFKWGAFDDERLINLEREYLDWADKLGDYIYDKSTDLVVKQVCLQTVDIQEKRLLGEKVKDELNSLQSLLNSSGLIEKTREKSSNNIKLGMTIKEIEDNHPLSRVDDKLVDVDKYGEIIDTFVGAMSRTLGKENYFTQRFDELYKNYSIDIIANSDIADFDGNEAEEEVTDNGS